ncbi:MAG: M14 family zinc carboxypeptidase [Candidatus Marinimicrobia bacterium]|nr:M14 family zinc carboxypeptidase [Candidatus Neomarinimicrobiota bacterium]
MMRQFATDYPGICRIDSIGRSVEGRAILFAVISDNVHSEEAEPEVMYSSTMHGDETTGYVLMLRLIDYLLTNYQSDVQVSNLVDNLEIWINPLANPDGTYYSGNSTVYGATRYNANGVDLNRNFPNPQDGDHPDGNLWQPETVAMLELAERQNFVLSANFHGGAELLNYPWDTWKRRHADDEWLIRLCRQYADTVQANSPAAYMTDMNNGISNGWDWYVIYGGRQDYMTYYQHCREVTIEISDTKLPPESELTAYWEYNRDALLNYLSAALTGIRGEIRTDQALGEMQISIVGHELDNSWIVPDKDFGDYYRLCLPGIYQLEITSGSESIAIDNITVSIGPSTRVNLITGTTIPGDVNADNDINIADVVLIQNYIAGQIVPNETEFNSADWNGDEILNQDDLDRIMQFLLNLYP